MFFKEGRSRRGESIRINRLTFYFFKEERRGRERAEEEGRGGGGSLGERR
jgi:hypothetical protein